MQKKNVWRPLVEWEERREEKRNDTIFFSLLLPANKIDRIQNVATKNPFPGKEKKRKKKRANANTYIYKHTHRLTKSIKILGICIN